MPKKRCKLLFLIIIFTIISCETPEDKRFFGQIIGSAVGAYVGGKFGSGTGKDLSIIFGGAAGFLIGGKLMDILSQEESDQFSQVIEESLDENPDNVTNEWMSESNKEIKAEVTPLNQYEIKDHICRDFRKIITKNGRQIEEESTACRDVNGNWKLI
tara:strand:- start:373 stop:843 length:471 start_codon:yes stop_codon:yes gene_type:complete